MLRFITTRREVPPSGRYPPDAAPHCAATMSLGVLQCQGLELPLHRSPPLLAPSKPGNPPCTQCPPPPVPAPGNTGPCAATPLLQRWGPTSREAVLSPVNRTSWNACETQRIRGSWLCPLTATLSVAHADPALSPPHLRKAVLSLQCRRKARSPRQECPSPLQRSAGGSPRSAPRGPQGQG